MNRINLQPVARRVLAGIVCGILAACADQAADQGRASADAGDAAACEPAAAREVVQRFGERLNQVSLLAPDTLVSRQMRESYGDFVTPELLDRWLSDPSAAPGRQVSSPWPDRIEVDEVQPEGAGCRVEGRVILVTSVEATQGGSAVEEPVTMQVVDDDGWRIAAYESRPMTAAGPARLPVDSAPESPDSPTASADADVGDPADVIRQYYDAIDARDYRRAFALWGNGGEASGQSYDDFAAGFAETANVEVEIGEPGRVEPAAGSRYVEIPVVISAETTRGETQRFEGSYTLRRTVVPGASAAARRWHIYSAKIAPAG